MKDSRAKIVGNSLTIVFVALLVLLIGAIIIFSVIGIFKVGTYMNMVEINLYPNIFYNVLYFSGLLIVSFLIAIILEILTRILLSFFKIKQSLFKNILSYSIQLILAFILINVIIDNLFTRIEIVDLILFIVILIIYTIIFITSSAHKGIDDLEDI